MSIIDPDDPVDLLDEAFAPTEKDGFPVDSQLPLLAPSGGEAGSQPDP